MKRYIVKRLEEGRKKYYYILDNNTFELVVLPTKYLKHKIQVNRSPNTVRRTALSLCYYLQYLSESEMELIEVSRLGFEEQSKHFVQFLYWLKEGRHIADDRIGNTRNGTCNAYLRDVFGFFLYLADNEYTKPLRVLSYEQITVPNAVGIRRTIRSNSFKGYLKAEERNVQAAEESELITVLHACTNIRDQLLLLLLAETGFRIGEILGVDYIRDIDYDNVLQTRVIKLIRKEDLRDDNGELFGFGSHMYRHYYCVKLAEMHLDDWTLAKLLGHASVRNVKYYRKMSSDVLADETRRVRNQLSEMILENLDGWENEYAKVRQNGGSK